MHRAIRLAVFAVASTLFFGPATAQDPPNVVFIISDDLSAEALSCYGNLQSATPNIDRLAGEGVRFTRAYSQYPICGPSRAALMSGMYPQAVGVMSNPQAERFGENMGKRPSMTELFKQNGYYTARVSKIYHMRVPGDITAGVDGPDHAASWTERFNCPGPEWMSSGMHTHLTNEKLDRNPTKHYGLGFGGAFYVVRGDTDGAEQPDAQAAEKAVSLLREHAGGPFFLAVGLVRPHVPLVAPSAYYDPYPAEAMTLSPRVHGDWDDIPRAGITKNSRAIGMHSRGQKQQALAAYYASVSFMDAQVGRILSALDELELRKNTIVVFTSDHGYHLGEHEFWQKMSLHEEAARIPLVIAAPGVAPAETDSLAQQIDLYPTFAEMAGLAVPEHCQGKSLAPVLADPNVAVHESVYTCMRNDHLLTTDRWSYIQYGDGSEELYDLQKDPSQYFSLAGTVATAGVLEAMRGRLADTVAAIVPAE